MSTACVEEIQRKTQRHDVYLLERDAHSRSVLPGLAIGEPSAAQSPREVARQQQNLVPAHRRIRRHTHTHT